MKKALILLIALLALTGGTASALSPTLPPTPTPSPRVTPSPTPGFGAAALRGGVKAFYDGEWHGLPQEMVWEQTRTDRGTLFADGKLHFMPLSEYVKDRDIPEAASIERFEYQITGGDDTTSVSGRLTVLRQDGEELERIDEVPEKWEDLEAGRYMFCFWVNTSGDGFSSECVALLWMNR